MLYSKLHVINGLCKIALLYHYYKHLYSFFYSTECLAWEFIQRQKIQTLLWLKWTRLCCCLALKSKINYSCNTNSFIFSKYDTRNWKSILRYLKVVNTLKPFFKTLPFICVKISYQIMIISKLLTFICLTWLNIV